MKLIEDKSDVVMNSKNDWRQPSLIRWVAVSGNTGSVQLEDGQDTGVGGCGGHAGGKEAHSSLHLTAMFVQIR